MLGSSASCGKSGRDQCYFAPLADLFPVMLYPSIELNRIKTTQIPPGSHHILSHPRAVSMCLFKDIVLFFHGRLSFKPFPFFQPTSSRGKYKRRLESRLFNLIYIYAMIFICRPLELDDFLQNVQLCF